jgi:hypothetical protein
LAHSVYLISFSQIPPPTKRSRQEHAKTMVVAKAAKAKAKKTTENLEDFEAALPT